MDTLYREEIMEHYKYPRNRGVIDHPDLTYEDTNPLCGDIIRIDIKKENNRIAEIKFSAKGCAISQAAVSMLSDMVEGKDLEEVKKIDKKAILDELGIELGPVRLKCALLGLKVLKAAVYGVKEWPS